MSAPEPILYTKNYVTVDDTYAVSSGAANIGYVYDRDNSAQWQSSGANSDATSVTIQITFYEKSVAVSRVFDTLALINHNIKNYTVAWWTGSAWTTFITQTADTSQSLSRNVSTYGNTPTALASFSSVTTSQILLTLNTTQTPNQEKAIGELICCNQQLNVGLDLLTYDLAFRQKVKDNLMGDGSLTRAVVLWTLNRYEKYEAKATFNFVSDSLLASFMSIKNQGLPVLWYPEALQRPDEFWLVHLHNPRMYKYMVAYKGAGNILSLDLKEV
jgi:hypothetical protein